MPKYQETVLKNGLRLITSTNDSTPIAVVSLWVKAGSRYENKQQWGYSHFLEHLLCKDLNDIYNNTGKNHIGAYINGVTGLERVHFIMEVSTKYIEDMLSVLSCVTHDFINNDAVEFETKKKVIIQEIQIAKENPKKLLSATALSVLLGDHPLGHETLGSLESVQNATAERLRDHQNSLFVPERSAVIVISNKSHNEILKLVTKYFESWKSNFIQKQEEATPISKNNINYLYIPSTGKQTSILINFHTPGMLNLEDELALVIIASYLGGGNKAFLQEKLRHETGLVYAVNVSNLRYTDTGIFQISTSSSEPAKVVKTIFESIDVFLKNITPKKIKELKEQVINIFERHNNNPRNEAVFLGQGFILFNKLFEPKNYKNLIEKITYEDVINVGKKYLNKDNGLLAILGPEDVKDKI